MTREVHPIVVAPRARSRARSVRARLALALLGLVWLLVAPAVHGADRSVVVLHATGIVDNVMASYLGDGIAGAARDGDAAVVIELDTPGGSLDSMRSIVTALEESTIPTIVWVGPSGARAASAGTFITLAANLVYMAPSTEIGAASPVDSSGGDITGTEGTKVMNDAVAYITGIAQLRGRPVDWAVSTVQQAISTPAVQAVDLGVADGLAASLDEVLAEANGKTITDKAGQQLTVDVAGAAVSEASMNPVQDLLHLLADPNIAFVLFTIGFYGLIFEVIHPNFATGIAGSISIVLALIGFGSLPLNAGGLLLVVLGIGLLVVDLNVTSHGLLTVGGIVAFVLGASALYASPGNPEAADVTVALPLIATMAIISAAFMLVVVRTVLRNRRAMALRPVPYGAGSNTPVPAGTPGEVRSPLRPTGTVFAAGEEWSARTADASAGAPPLPRGAPVVVIGQQGLTLIVEPAGARPAA
ncbi:MAG TPA: nodulation protein NfeD [Candidatus Limnocylindrales bacterium]|jgi:membrane-bound serine protease (ClpP class)